MNNDKPRWEDIDRIIHEPARLTLLLNLFVVKRADFNFLMRQTGMSKGNLSSHLSKLEEAGYILISKEFLGKKPQTWLSLTESGRQALEQYKVVINLLLESTR